MSTRTTQALWHENAGQSVIRQGSLESSPGTGTLIARHSLISIGTERLVATGTIPGEMHTDMAVPYMEGDLSLPVKYGYSLTGHLEGMEATLFHVMHPHQDVCAVSEDHLFEVPPGIPSARATLASNLETALNAVWDAQVLPGERVLVVGFGMIGSLVARVVAGIPGVDLEVHDIDPGRMTLCTQMGFTRHAHEHSAFPPFDVAFHTSATGPGLQRCIDAVGREGRIVELSWYGARSTQLELGRDFHSLRKRLLSSQVSDLPAHMRSRWDTRRRKQKVFDLLADPAYDQHITHVISLEEAAELFNTWRHKAPAGLGYCIRYH